MHAVHKWNIPLEVFIVQGNHNLSACHLVIRAMPSYFWVCLIFSKLKSLMVRINFNFPWFLIVYTSIAPWIGLCELSHGRPQKALWISLKGHWCLVHGLVDTAWLVCMRLWVWPPQHHTHKTGKQTKRDLMYLQSHYHTSSSGRTTLRLLEKELAAFFGSSASAETSCALQLSLNYSGHEFFPSPGCGVSTRSPGSILCLRVLIII